MAIRKSLNERFLRYVWSLDSAINFDLNSETTLKPVYRKYLETRNLDDLKPILKDGAIPAEFDLGCLTRAQRATAEMNPEGSAGYYADIVAYGLRSVRNFEVEDSNGFQPVMIETVDTPVGKKVKPEILDKMYDKSLFEALASRILEISRIDPSRGQA